MIPLTGPVVTAIYNASRGYLSSDEVDEAVETLSTDEEIEDLLKLLSALHILHDGEVIMTYPANLFPV